VRLSLERFCYSPTGVFGSMMVDGAMLWTVERPWLDNARWISCIPAGTYRCGPRRYFRGGYDAIEVRDVPGRSFILFHKANLPEQLGGCIAPASRLGCLRGQWAGLGSGAAFELLMDVVGGREWELHIGAIDDLATGLRSDASEDADSERDSASPVGRG
jgi:hypothetical protein